MADFFFLLAQIVCLGLLPIVLFCIAYKSLRPALYWLSSILFLLVIGSFCELCSGGESALRRCLRRGIFCLLWPAIHTIAAPTYLEIWRAMLVIVMLACHIIVVIAGLGSLLFLFGRVSISQIGAFGLVVLAVALVSAAFIAFAIILSGFLRNTVYPVLKVFADIVLWLADGDYRRRLRVAFGAEIRFIRMSAGDTLMLATHSLGTVIALDYLLSSHRDLGNSNKLVLVTAGSPLKSLLNAFFPEWFSDPCLIYEALDAEYSGLKWINVYRPWDPIGRKLGIHGMQNGADRSTKQWHLLLFSAHINYWYDQKVLEAIQQLLAEPTEGQGVSRDTLKRSLWLPSENKTCFRPIARIWDYSRQIAVTSIIAVGIFTLYCCFKWNIIDLRGGFHYENPFDWFAGVIGFTIVVCIYGGIVALLWKHTGYLWLSSLIGVPQIRK